LKIVNQPNFSSTPRRHPFVEQISLFAAIAYASTSIMAQSATNPLMIPPTLTGPVYNLNMAFGTTPFHDGPETVTAGYNGNILGPTLIMTAGEFVTLNVTNNLGEATTTHWHGMHVSSRDDGGPHTVIAPGATWSPDFTVLDTASTMWYHPHLHGITHDHVNAGLAGMILIRDSVEALAGLPITYGVDEFPLIIQDKGFAGGNSLAVANLGQVTMVNATLDPYLNAPAQMVRFRILNGASERGFNLGFSDDRIFHVVGADGGLLEAPTPVTRALVMPGERLDIVVNLGSNNGSTVQLVTFASELPRSIPGAEGGPGGNNPLNGVDHTLLEIRVGALTAGAVTTLPANIWTLDRLYETNATVTRTIQLTGGGQGNPLSLDNQSFNSSRMDQVVIQETTEIWRIDNRTRGAHPFHIHDIQFFILDRNGVPPSPREAGKKDTVVVDENEIVRFIAKFERHSDTEVPYMYHCHILPHEDGGMMGQFIVVNPAAQLIDLTPGATDLTLRWSKNLGPGIFNLQSSGVINSTFTNVTVNPSLVNDRNQIIWNIDRAARFFQLKPVQ
jgi:FtsP/CotA-like multicopper oxidase with cupredoxin domain